MIDKQRHLLTGNEAIARGAYEAGVSVCSASVSLISRRASWATRRTCSKLSDMGTNRVK